MYQREKSGTVPREDGRPSAIDCERKAKARHTHSSIKPSVCSPPSPSHLNGRLVSDHFVQRDVCLSRVLIVFSSSVFALHANAARHGTDDSGPSPIMFSDGRVSRESLDKVVGIGGKQLVDDRLQLFRYAADADKGRREDSAGF